VKDEFKRPLEVVHLQGDSTKAQRELGWKPKTSFKGISAYDGGCRYGEVSESAWTFGAISENIFSCAEARTNKNSDVLDIKKSHGP